MFGYLWESWKTEPKPKFTEAELMHQKADAAVITRINSTIKANTKIGCYRCGICLDCKETTLDEYYKNKGYEVKTWTNNNSIAMEISW